MGDGHGQPRVQGMSTEDVLDFNRQIIDEFRSNEGRCGGMFEGTPMILLTMTGARSGRTLTTPLTYTAGADDDCIVFASAGGSPTHPSWFHNVVAHPDVVVERGAERYEARAVVTEGDDRQDAYDAMVAAVPRFGGYQDAVEREIPVIRLVRR